MLLTQTICHAFENMTGKLHEPNKSLQCRWVWPTVVYERSGCLLANSLRKKCAATKHFRKESP